MHNDTFRSSKITGENYALAGAALSLVFFAYFLLNRSTRPAESTNFCLPV